MISRRRLLGASVLGLSLAACRRGGNLINPASNLVRFAIPAAERGRAGAFLGDMQAATGLEVVPVYVTDDEAFAADLRRGAADLGWFSNEAALEAVRGSGAEVFARLSGPFGEDGFHSLLIARPRGPSLAQVMRCDRRLTFAMGRPQSMAGALAPVAYLFAPRGVSPGACFRSVRADQGAIANIAAVARGEVDVATTTDVAVAALEERDAAGARQAQVIWTSPLLPEAPLVWRKTLDPAVKEKIRQFLITYGQGGEDPARRERANLAGLGVGGFLPADNSHLLPIEQMQTARDWLQARDGGDARKIAAARRRYDEATARLEALEQRTRMPAAEQ